jgi:hypothetical protein
MENKEFNIEDKETYTNQEVKEIKTQFNEFYEKNTKDTVTENTQLKTKLKEYEDKETHISNNNKITELFKTHDLDLSKKDKIMNMVKKDKDMGEQLKAISADTDFNFKNPKKNSNIADMINNKQVENLNFTSTKPTEKPTVYTNKFLGKYILVKDANGNKIKKMI